MPEKLRIGSSQDAADYSPAGLGNALFVKSTMGSRSWLIRHAMRRLVIQFSEMWRRFLQLFSRRNTQSEIASPLLMSACTRPSIMKVGDTWIPFWRAYLQCHLTSRSRSRIAKASESLAPL